MPESHRSYTCFRAEKGLSDVSDTAGETFAEPGKDEAEASSEARRVEAALSGKYKLGRDFRPEELTSLAEVRTAIDEIDRELILAFNRRAALAQRVAEIKRSYRDSTVLAGPQDSVAVQRAPHSSITAPEGFAGNKPDALIAATDSVGPEFYRPEREACILRAARAVNPGPLPDASVVLLVRELMSACLALEAPLSVAFLGPAGTFTEQAARKHFGHAVKLESALSVSAVFDAVERGQAEFGVVPIENSTEGVVTSSVDRFVASRLKIVGEVILPIEHTLLGDCAQQFPKTSDCSAQGEVAPDRGSDPAADPSVAAEPIRMLDEAAVRTEVHTVHAHPQAFAQCRVWLERHLPRADLHPSTSNAQAILDARAAGAGHAAIGPAHSGEAAGLCVLARCIQDSASNTTRFLVIGRSTVPPSGEDKTSVMIVTRNRAGALYDALRPFAEAGVSLTRIESRPSRSGLWEYVFFLDLLGHELDAPVAQALSALERDALLVKRLGSYPRAAT